MSDNFNQRFGRIHKFQQKYKCERKSLPELETVFNQKSFYFLNKVDTLLSWKQFYYSRASSPQIQTQKQNLEKDDPYIYKRLSFNINLNKISRYCPKTRKKFHFKKKSLIDSSIKLSEENEKDEDQQRKDFLKIEEISNDNEDLDSLTDYDRKNVQISPENLQKIEARNREILQRSCEGSIDASPNKKFEKNKKSLKVVSKADLQTKSINKDYQKKLKEKQLLQNSLRRIQFQLLSVLGEKNLISKEFQKIQAFLQENLEEKFYEDSVLKKINEICEEFNVNFHLKEDLDQQEQIKKFLSFVHEEILDLKHRNGEKSKNEEIKKIESQNQELKQIIKKSQIHQKKIDNQNSVLKKKIEKQQKLIIDKDRAIKEQLEELEELTHYTQQIENEVKYFKKENQKLKECFRRTQDKIVRKISSKMNENEKLDLQEEELEQFVNVEDQFFEDRDMSLISSEKDTEFDQKVENIDNYIEKQLKSFFTEQQTKYELLLQQAEDYKTKFELLKNENDDLKIQNQKCKIATLNMKNLLKINQKLNFENKQLQEKIKYYSNQENSENEQIKRRDTEETDLQYYYHMTMNELNKDDFKGKEELVGQEKKTEFQEAQRDKEETFSIEEDSKEDADDKMQEKFERLQKQYEQSQNLGNKQLKNKSNNNE